MHGIDALSSSANYCTVAHEHAVCHSHFGSVFFFGRDIRHKRNRNAHATVYLPVIYLTEP